MELIICAGKASKDEILAQDLNDNVQLHWIERPEKFLEKTKAD